MIFIGVPTRGIIFTETIKPILEIIRDDDDYLLTTISPVSQARNEIVRAFLASAQDFLFMVDDDEVIPIEGHQALYDMEGDSDVIVIDSPSKRTGRSNIFRNKDGSIAATGFGCALFTRKVFETIPEPWFDLSPRRTVEKVNGNWKFPVIEGAEPNPWGGEDINFCMKLHEHGFKIRDVPGLTCTHLEYEPFTNEERATRLLEIKRYEEISGPPL